MESNPEKFEKKLKEVQSNIQEVENRIKFTDSEKRMDTQESQSKIKKNDLEIQQLNMEIKELQIRIERGKKADEIMAAKALEKYAIDIRKVKGKSAKEIIQELDSEVIELEKRKKEIDHELELQKRAYRHSEEDYQKKVSECDADFANEPTQDFCQQKARELQNEQQDIDSKIRDSEIAEGVLQRMKIQLRKILSSQVRLYLEAQREFEELQKSTEELVVQINLNASQASPNKKKSSLKVSGDFEPYPNKDASDKKRVQFSSGEGSKVQAYLNEQEYELHEMKEALAKISGATTVSDIKDAEGRILEQKLIHDDLVDLKKRLSRTLQELRATKRQQDTKMDIFQGANPNGPKRELEEAVSLAKRRQKEQEKRQERAKKELHAISSLLENARNKFLKVLQLIGKKIPQADPSLEIMSNLDLGTTIESFFQNLKKKNDEPFIMKKKDIFKTC